MQRKTREYFINPSYREILRDDALGVVVQAFAARRQRPDFHLRFRAPDRAEKYVADWFAGIQTKAQKKQATRDALAVTPNPLSVGDVLCASWGYDQTNIDYYQVVGLYGKRGVVLREIASQHCGGGSDTMTGRCIPVPDQFIGAELRRMVAAAGGVKIASYAWAVKKEPELVGGQRVYSYDNWTAYA